MVQAAAQAGQQAAVARGDGVVDIRFGHPAREQVEHRQQHGAHGVERVGIGHIGVLLEADIGEQLHEIPALQKGERVDAFLLEQSEQHVPVRVAQPHQLPQGGALGLMKKDRLLLAMEAEGVVQKDFLHLFHVGRQLIHELAPVFSLGPDDPEGELLPGHGLDIGVHPGGHAAMDIGVGALQHQTNAHGLTPLSFQCGWCRRWL